MICAKCGQTKGNCHIYFEDDALRMKRQPHEFDRAIPESQVKSFFALAKKAAEHLQYLAQNDYMSPNGHYFEGGAQAMEIVEEIQDALRDLDAECEVCGGSGWRIINPEWPSGEQPYRERCPEGCTPRDVGGWRGTR